MAGRRAFHTVGTAARWMAVSVGSAVGASAATAVLGRIVLRVISWFDGDPFTQFTWRGTWVVLKVVFLGTVPVGFAFALLRPLPPGRWVVQGLALGMVLALYPGVPICSAITRWNGSSS